MVACGSITRFCRCCNADTETFKMRVTSERHKAASLTVAELQKSCIPKVNVPSVSKDLDLGLARE